MKPGMVFPNPLGQTLADVSALAEAGAKGLVALPKAFVDDSFNLSASPDDLAAAFAGEMKLVGIMADQPLVSGGSAEAGTSHIRSCLDLADAMREFAPENGMPVVVFDAGTYESGQKDAAYKMAVESLKEVAQYAEERQVILGLKPDRASVVNRARAAATMLGEVAASYVQIALDAAATVGDKDTLDDAVGRLKDNIVVALARDVKFGGDGTAEYPPPGLGVLNYTSYADLLAGAPGCGYLVLGVLSTPEETKVAMAKLCGFVK
jgi:sugar phosphate isomerase/epimerase